MASHMCVVQVQAHHVHVCQANELQVRPNITIKCATYVHMHMESSKFVQMGTVISGRLTCLEEFPDSATPASHKSESDQTNQHTSMERVYPKITGWCAG